MPYAMEQQRAGSSRKPVLPGPLQDLRDLLGCVVGVAVNILTFALNLDPVFRKEDGGTIFEHLPPFAWFNKRSMKKKLWSTQHTSTCFFVTAEISLEIFLHRFFSNPVELIENSRYL